MGIEGSMSHTLHFPWAFWAPLFTSVPLAGASSALSEQLLDSIYVFPKANTAGDSYHAADLCDYPSKATININGKSNTSHESHSGVTGSISSPWHLPIQHLNMELTFPTAPGARSALQDE